MKRRNSKTVLNLAPAMVGAAVLTSLVMSGCPKEETDTPASKEPAAEPSVDNTNGGQPVATTDKKQVPITVYSGRNESLVGPIFAAYEKATGNKINVRYGKTAALAALLIEEGDKSPAALFFAQDAGALGALAEKKRLEVLPKAVLERVPATYRAKTNDWVGVTGRARVFVYNTDKVKAAELPTSVFDLTDPKWKGRAAWAPTNGSFQAFVTAMRMMHGEEKTEAWLLAMKKNDVKDYPKNSPIVRAAGAGEIDIGIVNHYYLHRFTKEDPAFKAKNHNGAAGDVGALVNVSGAGMLVGKNKDEAQAAFALLNYLLSDEAQGLFASSSNEYPLVVGVDGPKGEKPLAELSPPDVNLSDLKDLDGTLALLKKAKLIP